MFCNLILEHYEENVSPYWPYVNITRPFSLIYYVVKGAGTYTINGTTEPFLKKHLYIFPPNTPFSLNYDENDELRILFVHAYIDPEPKQLIHLDTQTDKFLEDTVKLLRMYVKKTDIIYTVKLTEMLLSYITEKHNKNSTSIGKEIKKYIEENYIEVYKSSDISSAFNYSNSHILKIFKHDYNTTPRKYALKLLLQYIVSLLRDGMPINQIASSLDFSSPENFSKFFKNNFGVPPSELQQQLIKK